MVKDLMYLLARKQRQLKLEFDGLVWTTIYERVFM